MIIFGKAIAIRTTDTENFIFNECYDYIGKIVDEMQKNDCNEMISTETGEVIEIHELYRMRGILDGLPIMSAMYKDKMSQK